MASVAGVDMLKGRGIGGTVARGRAGRWGRRVSGALAAFGIVVAVAASARELRAEGSATCGTPGLPPCPLQAWMRQRIAGPLASNDMASLAAGLDAAARFSPDPAWTQWARYANEGAAAARQGDVATARRACKACHGHYRAEYRARYRDRPLPAVRAR